MVLLMKDTGLYQIIAKIIFYSRTLRSAFIYMYKPMEETKLAGQLKESS